MTQAPSELQLRTTVARLMRLYPEARLFGFYCGTGYLGEHQLNIDGQALLVEEVRSPLHFHQLAWQSEQHDRRYICLCPCREWVDQDLRDRMARRDLLDSDPWEAVQDLFRAHQVDPLLRRQRSLAQWALEAQPPQGFPAALGGVLTTELFWGCLLEARLQLSIDAYDPSQLLMQAGTHPNPSPLISAPQELVERAADWLAQRGGELVRELVLLIRRQGVIDTLALGVLCEVLYLGPELADSLMARGRLEQFFPDRPWSPPLGQAFGRLLRQLTADPQACAPWLAEVLERARVLLAQLRAEALAEHSLILPQGWHGLLEQIGQAFMPLKSARPEGLKERLQQARQHRLADSHQRELVRVEMALRLLRYLQQVRESAWTRLADATQHYVDELAWVDRARQRLLEGATQPALAQAFRALLDQLKTRREPFNQNFAELAIGPGAEVPGVETFLDRLAVPLAREQRLLIIVLDGCSQAVLLELLHSLEEREWVCYLPDHPAQGQLLSALPSVTEVARTSLLSGQLVQGKAADEKEAYSRHPGLRAVCRKDYPPQLYHKKDLAEGAVYERLRSDDYRVISVVVNSIDDTLARDEQLDLSWSSQLIAPLEGLLQAARFRGRMVLLVSDHGHLLEDGTAELPAAGGAGNRWQPGDEAQPGAVVARGGRLQLADPARLLYSESLRWGPKKRGYHGGLSPQEMVCALALLGAPGQKIAGWHEGRRPAPSWWDPLPQAPFAPSQAQGSLFENPRPLSEVLAETTVWQSRRKTLPPPPHLERLLELLGQSAEASLDQLTTHLGLSRPQVRTYGVAWIRWLNVDGEPVLSLQGEQLRLDRDALRRAFGV